MYLSVLWMSIPYFCGLRVNFFASMGEMYDYEELFVIRMFDLCVDMIITPSTTSLLHQAHILTTHLS